jgi:PAS domain S-box-containing protein
VGGYRLAWIGFAEHDEGKTLRPVAHAGFDSGYIKAAQVSWGDNERGRGPGGTAIRTGQPSIARHILSDPDFIQWREAAILRGYKSLIALPLISEGQTLGAMGIYSNEDDAFGTKEVEILQRGANDLAFGISALRARTKQLQAENALKQSEEKYRTLVQKIQVAVVVHGADTQILVSNSMAQELLGLSADQMFGKTAIDPAWHFYREDGSVLPQAEYPVNQVLASRSALRNCTLGVHRPQREDIWVLVNADPVFVDTGALEQVVVSFIDISDRKHAELGLRESEEALKEAQRLAHVGSWYMDLATNEVVWSEVLYQMYGFDPSQPPPLYTESMKLFTPESWERLSSAITRATETGISYELELEMVPKGGGVRWMLARGELVRDESGKPVRVRGVVMDITERKRSEAEIRQLNQVLELRVRERTAQLEIANKELEAFSFSVSHDLRTPLRAIDGFSQILLEDYEAKLDAEGCRLLHVVRDNTRKMGALIDDILKFSRAGRTALSCAEIDMAALAREVYSELQSSMPTENLQLEIDAIPPVQCDRAMMRQVFANLLSNALKFSHTRETPEVRVGSFIEGGETVYFVRDNGVGFDMQYADKLFGVFQRLHGVDEFEGTGIGLAIVKRIVVRHGGRVWAEGKPGQGASFYFSLRQREQSTS